MKGAYDNTALELKAQLDACKGEMDLVKSDREALKKGALVFRMSLTHRSRHNDRTNRQTQGNPRPLEGYHQGKFVSSPESRDW